MAQRHALQALNNSLSQQKEVYNLIPRLLNLMSKSYMDIQRDADILRQIIAGLRQKSLNLDAYSHIYPILNMRSFENLVGELITVEEIWLDSEFVIKMKVHAHLIDDNVLVYKSLIFDDWIDAHSCQVSTDKFWAIYNKTNNCSRFIDEPRTKLVHKSCAVANQSLPEPNIKWMFGYFSNEEIAKIEPQVVEYGNFKIVSCFHHNISLGDSTLPCDKRPYSIPVNYSFRVIGYEHQYFHEQIYFTGKS